MSLKREHSKADAVEKALDETASLLEKTERIKQKAEALDKQMGSQCEPRITTLVNFVLDASGSMRPWTGRTVSGFNEYVQNLRIDGDDDYVSLTTFNTECSVHYAATQIADVPVLDETVYRAGGLTALNDAVGLTIEAIERRLREMPEHTAVLVVIITDGMENASSRFTSEEIRQKIARLSRGCWSFVFLGADIDVWEAGGGIGIRGTNVARFDADHPDAMFRVLARSTSCRKQMLARCDAPRCSGQVPFEFVDPESVLEKKRPE